MVLKEKENLDRKYAIIGGIIIIVIIISSLVLFIKPQTNVQECGAQTETSSLYGTLTAYSTLYSDTGSILWSERKDSWVLNPIDPSTGHVIGDLRIALDIDLTGQHFLWDGLFIVGTLEYNRYAGCGGSIEWAGAAAALDTKTFTVNSTEDHQTGMLQFDPLNVLSLIPDTVSTTMLEWSEEEQRKIRVTIIYEQKAGDHPIEMTFTAKYHLHFLLNGEEYDQYFTQTFDLSFFWEHSVVVPPPPPTGHSPYISNLEGTCIKDGDKVTLRWSAGDLDMDYDYYTITVDDEVVVMASWSGVDITYTKGYIGARRFVVICTVYDDDGNSASDVVYIDAYASTESPLPADPDYDPDRIEVETGFKREIDPIYREPALNVFGIEITAASGAIILIATTVIGIVAIAIMMIYYPSWLGGKKK